MSAAQSLPPGIATKHVFGITVYECALCDWYRAVVPGSIQFQHAPALRDAQAHSAYEMMIARSSYDG